MRSHNSPATYEKSYGEFAVELYDASKKVVKDKIKKELSELGDILTPNQSSEEIFDK